MLTLGNSQTNGILTFDKSQTNGILTHFNHSALKETCNMFFTCGTLIKCIQVHNMFFTCGTLIKCIQVHNMFFTCGTLIKCIQVHNMFFTCGTLIKCIQVQSTKIYPDEFISHVHLCHTIPTAITSVTVKHYRPAWEHWQNSTYHLSIRAIQVGELRTACWLQGSRYLLECWNHQIRLQGTQETNVAGSNVAVLGKPPSGWDQHGKWQSKEISNLVCYASQPLRLSHSTDSSRLM